MHPMTIKKEELKDMAKRLRTLKSSRKERNRDGRKLSDIEFDIWKLRRQYRHEHIAYCLVRGRTYEQIEQPREHNKPNWALIDKAYNELKKKVDEADTAWRVEHPLFRVANE